MNFNYNTSGGYIMGRQQKRKEQLKNKNFNNDKLDTTVRITTILKLVGFIVILLFVIYYVLAVFVTKEINVSGNKGDDVASEETTNNSGVSNKILATNIFEQSEEEYYVYFYDFSDENNVVASAVSGISSDILYRVDTGSSLNAKYVVEEGSNRDVTKVEDLKVVAPTVIKIQGDEIVEYYEGSAEIRNGLK